jgi:hypothetical protein
MNCKHWKNKSLCALYKVFTAWDFTCVSYKYKYNVLEVFIRGKE